MSRALLAALAARARADGRRWPARDSEVTKNNHIHEKKTCRICFKEGKIKLFSTCLGRSLADDMRLCSGITVFENDGYPKWLCDSCHLLLKYSMTFRDMCQRSVEKLSMLQLANSGNQIVTSAPGTDIESNSCFDEDFTSSEFTPQREGFTRKICCSSCNKEFNERNEYRLHRSSCKQSLINKNIETKGKKEKQQINTKHLCETCGKELSSIYSLISHRTIHINEFPFKCDKCPYRGKTKGLLRTHLKVHSEEKPYMCTSCPSSFRTASNLMKHRLIHEGKEDSQCSFCNKMFKTKQSVDEHIRNLHSNRPSVACSICGKVVKAPKALRKHRLKVHNLKAEHASGRVPSYLLCHADDPPGDSPTRYTAPEDMTSEQ